MMTVNRACRAAILTALLGGCVLGARAAAPDWVKRALARVAHEPPPASDAQFALVSDQIRYLTADRVRARQRIVVRVLADGGRQYADFSAAYRPDCERIVSAEAWVLSRQGRRVEKYGVRDFSDTVETYDSHIWDSDRVLDFDASDRVEAGDVVAAEIEIESISGVFDTSRDFFDRLPIARRVLDVTPPVGMTLVWHASSGEIPAPRPGAAPGSLHWEMDDLPARVGSAPSDFLVNPLRVSVHPVHGGSAPTWSALAGELSGVIKPQLTTGPSVRSAADGLVTGRSSRWDRIRALAGFVQSQVSYLEITTDHDYLAGYRPHRPAQVLANRYGDCKDKAALLVAMLHAIGERAWLVLVNSGNPKALAADWPSAWFNHAIVAIPADAAVPAGWPCADSPGLGRVVLFDPTDPVTPLGLLPDSDQAGLGLAIAPESTGVLHLPASDPHRSTLTRQITGSIDADGGVKVAVVEQRQGNLAADAHEEHWARGTDDFGKLLQRRVHEILPLTHDLTWKDHWDPIAARYDLKFQFAAAQFGRRASTFLFVCPKVVPDRGLLPPWRIPAEGVSWLQGSRVHETVRLAVPHGFVIDSLPRPVRAQTPHVTYQLRYETQGDQVVFNEQVDIQPGFVDKSDYQALSTVFSSLRKSERRLVTLRTQP